MKLCEYVERIKRCNKITGAESEQALLKLEQLSEARARALALEKELVTMLEKMLAKYE